MNNTESADAEVKREVKYVGSNVFTVTYLLIGLGQAIRFINDTMPHDSFWHQLGWTLLITFAWPIGLGWWMEGLK